ncbi:MAG: IS701 family transposase, partial [Endozoicomonadaceae bacterium]|nr:IS701 family transposase [Endozoicomonadaceae bacterium]
MDDTIQEKPHSDENELICWHYDHGTGQTVKGINILNMLYSSGDTKIPVAFELIEKPVVFYDIATRKQKRKSNIT